MLEKELNQKLEEFEDHKDELPSGIAESDSGSQRPKPRPIETRTSILAIDSWWSALWECFHAPHTDATNAKLFSATKSFCCAEDDTDLFNQVAHDVRRLEVPKPEALEGPLHEPPAEAAGAIEVPPSENEQKDLQRPPPPSGAVEVADAPAPEKIEEVDATAKQEPGAVFDRTIVTRSVSNPGGSKQSYVTALGHGSSRLSSNFDMLNIRKYRKKAEAEKRRTRPFRKQVTASEFETPTPDGGSFSSLASETVLGNEMAALFRMGALEEETPESGQCLQSWHRKALLDCFQGVSVSSFVTNAIPLPEQLKEQQNADDLDTPSAPATVPEPVSGRFPDVGGVFRERALRFSSFAIALAHSLVNSRTKSCNTMSGPHLFAEAVIPIQENSFCCAISRAKFFTKAYDSSDCLRVQLRYDGVYAIGFRQAEANKGACNVNYLKLLEPRFSVSDTLRFPSVLETTSQYAELCGHFAGSESFLHAYFRFFLNCTVLGRDAVMTAVRSVDSTDEFSEPSLQAVLESGGAILRDGRMRVTLPSGDGLFAAPVLDVREFVFGERGSSRVSTAQGRVTYSRDSTPRSGRTSALICRAREYRVAGKRTSSCLMVASILHHKDPAPVHALSVASVQTMNVIRLMSLEQRMNLDILKGSDAKHYDNVTGALNAVIGLFELSEAERKLITSFDQSQNIAREERVNLFPGQLALVSELVPQVPGQGCTPATPQPSEETDETVKLHHLQLVSLSKFSYLTPLFVSSACFTLPE